MFDQYVKLFHFDWIEPWMVEAVATMGAAVLLGVVVYHAYDLINK